MSAMTRRRALALALAALATPAFAEARPVLRVAKTPWCGCCGAWVAHMRAAGFEVETVDMDNAALAAHKARLGLRPEHASCHTGEIADYVIEGHVPAKDVARLLDERPAALGLSVPGMPIGSPGMEMGDRRDPFETLLVRADGSAAVFARH